MSVKLLLVYVITEFLLCLTPGPAVLLVVSQGINRGFKASFKGTLGIEAGNLLYFALSALGLGAVLLASTNLFQIVRWLGVAYLFVIGVKMLISRGRDSEVDGRVVSSGRSVELFGQGVITQLINPKALVFFTALLPQFISPGGRVLEQFLILGIVSLLVEIPVLAAYGWLAARGGRLIPKRLDLLPDRIAGVFLIGAGAGLAAMRRP